MVLFGSLLDQCLGNFDGAKALLIGFQHSDLMQFKFLFSSKDFDR